MPRLKRVATTYQNSSAYNSWICSQICYWLRCAAGLAAIHGAIFKDSRVHLFELEFYGLVNIVKVMLSLSVNLKTDNCPSWISRSGIQKNHHWYVCGETRIILLFVQFFFSSKAMCIHNGILIHKSNTLFSTTKSLQAKKVQSNLNSSNTNGSSTMANLNSFLSPYEILLIAQ